MKKILVIGSINMDFNIRMNRLPSIGETLISDSCKLNPGGKGANQAIAVAKLGGNVKFICAVGSDANSKTLLDNLTKNGVPYDAETIEGVSGTAIVTVVNGDNCIIVNEGANGAVTPDIIRQKEEHFKQADIIILQLEIPTDAVEAAVELGHKWGKTVILNPAPVKELNDNIYKQLSYIVPNEHEAEILTGIKIKNDGDAVNALKELRKRGCKNVIITLGSRGSVFNMNDEIIFRDAVKTKAVDTTAAGDCFIGALSVMLAQGKHVDEAVDFATEASAITVSRHGACSSIPTKDEIFN